jgi:REP element-mobilizing transposase RayT
MPRIKRPESATGIYHVMLRGVNRGQLFENDADYLKFLSFLKEVKADSGFTLYAYCLMNNHVHLLLKTEHGSLARIFRRLGTRYAAWFNKKYDRAGHLFQDRYKSEAVEDDAYFITVLCYIYQNPVKAGLCQTGLAYRWGSRRYLEGKGKPTDSDEPADNDALTEIAPISLIKQRERDLIDDDLIDVKIGRRAVYSDAGAASLMKELAGIASGPDFGRLDRESQLRVVLLLRGKRVPIRQIARITGLSKGIVEYWEKRAIKRSPARDE